MIIIPYDREKVVNYAKYWALKRNPVYFDFSKIGGDCTSFASQCLFQGASYMNYTKTFGWYYSSLKERSPGWSGVEYFHNFLTNNLIGVGNKAGPFAKIVQLSEVLPGDFIQLGYQNLKSYHTLVVSEISNGEILVCTHTSDAYNRPISSYRFQKARAIRILGVRKPPT